MLKRFLTLWLVLAVWLAPLSPVLSPVFAGGSGTANSTHDEDNPEDFVDKWLLNGNAIGSAAGATLGQMLGTVMFPGPVGWVVGSFLGGMIGGVIGNLIDNQINEAYNYTSFDRPPIEDGGLILDGVGPWEQGFYQVDQWVISGGGIGSLLGHFGVNLFGHMLPGPLGKIASSYAGIFFSDVVFGTIGDGLDGLIDMGDWGRKIDENNDRIESKAEARPGGSPQAPETSADKGDARREAYAAYLAKMADPAVEAEVVQEAYEAYRALQ